MMKRVVKRATKAKLHMGVIWPISKLSTSSLIHCMGMFPSPKFQCWCLMIASVGGTSYVSPTLRLGGGGTHTLICNDCRVNFSILCLNRIHLYCVEPKLMVRGPERLAKPNAKPPGSVNRNLMHQNDIFLLGFDVLKDRILDPQSLM